MLELNNIVPGWKKGTTLKLFLVPQFRIRHLKKKTDNIIIHVGTNNAPPSPTPVHMKCFMPPLQSIWNVSWNAKSEKFHFEIFARITISTPVLLVDKANVNDINKAFTELVKESNLDYISHENIRESHIDECGLHINRTGSSILA